MKRGSVFILFTDKFSCFTIKLINLIKCWISMRPLISISILLVMTASSVASCSDNDMRKQYTTDDACIRANIRDANADFIAALRLCDAPTPDLTGDRYLQTLAQSLNINYKIRPMANAMSKGNYMPTGSHISE